MYYHFYGLQENPFALTADPKYLFLSASHKEALASIIYGVEERKGLVLILGDAGTGKTTLLRHILEQSGTEVKTACMFQAVATFEELLQMVCRELEVPYQGQQRRARMEALHDYLLKEAAAGRYVVLLIDEVQCLSADVLEELRRLSDVETGHGKLIQIILAGQPEFAANLGCPELRQLRQRISVVAQLQPLTLPETSQYIAHRLKVAGHTHGAIFTRRALARIQQVSGGLPRLINIICDNTLLLGYGAEMEQLSSRMVKEAIKDRSVFGKQSMATQKRVYRRRATILLSLLAALVLLGLAVGVSGQAGQLLYRLWRVLIAGVGANLAPSKALLLVSCQAACMAMCGGELPLPTP
jgi:general secretion pathway protein A